MTRQQQNSVVLAAMATYIQDQPNLEEHIGSAFDTWFQQLAAAGLQQMQAATVAQPPAEQAA